MEATVSHFRERLREPWLAGYAPKAVLTDFDKYLGELRGRSGPVLLATRNDYSFLLYALASLALRRPCVLASESWPAAMWEDLSIGADTIVGTVDLPISDKSGPSLVPGSLLVATGGSGGKLRFAMHSWNALQVTVEGYRQFWSAERIDVVNLLPLYHVGGFVPAMRSFITGGCLSLASWKSVEGGILPTLPSTQAHVSLVPTQLKRLLAKEESCDWLRGFEAVLIGGGATPQALLDEAQSKQVRVVTAYGMTEALGTIALRRSGSSTSSSVGSGELLPHWEVKIAEDEILLGGEALFQGYVPGDKRMDAWHATGDLGALGPGRTLTVLGRKDRLINTGGEKVNPTLVEEALRNSGLCRDAAVIGIEDEEWGQRVVAVVEGDSSEEASVRSKLRELLPAYAIPKQMCFVDRLPRNAMGKLDQKSIRSLFV